MPGKESEVSPPREIWVLPEITGKADEISKLSYGLLSEARYIADKVGGSVTALVLSDRGEDYSDILGRYGVANARIYKHPLLKHFSAEAYSAALFDSIQSEKPWLFLMGNTVVGKELAPRLAALLETGVISNCVRMDVRNPQKPKFYRPIYGEQAHQEVVFQTSGTMLITMNPEVLNIASRCQATKTRTTLIEPKLSPEAIRVKHLQFLAADFKTVDIADADIIVAAGSGTVTSDVLPLVEELSALIEGAIGATRPVVDEGKLPKERLIGQTGKVVSPNLYLALGISGATHHLAGIQESRTIVSVNRDSKAPIVPSSDVAVIADLRDVLPGLIEKIKQAKRDGTIL